MPFAVASADGAITLANGTVIITKGTAAALTIDNPPSEGVHSLKIVSTTAAAHTLDYTAGFGGGTTSRDRATWGGAISDGMVLIGYGGVWYVSSTRNVTLG
jgi:hypothetical protein